MGRTISKVALSKATTLLFQKSDNCKFCNMCTSIRKIKPLSTTTTIHNMFFVRNQVTVCILATVIIQLFCVNSPVLANSQPLSLIGDQPEQPVSPVPGQPPAPRARPQPRRPNHKRPPRRGPGLPSFQDVACLGSDIGVNQKLKDENYMKQQLDCVLDKGPCDKNGQMIKRLAPDVLKGHCPNPCNICTRRQIKRVMASTKKISKKIQRNVEILLSTIMNMISKSLFKYVIY